MSEEAFPAEPGTGLGGVVQVFYYDPLEVDTYPLSLVLGAFTEVVPTRQQIAKIVVSVGRKEDDTTIITRRLDDA